MLQIVKPTRPTLRTIALEAQVSVGTVSRALANDPAISSETRGRIFQLAQSVGYTPDRAAQRLRTGRTQVIGLVLNPHDEILGFGTSIIRGLTAGLRDTNYHLVAMPSIEGEPVDGLVKRVVRNSLADGLIFTRTEPQDIRVRFLLEEGFPFVSHGRTELATPHAFVDHDNFNFSVRAVRKLINAGATKVAILLPPRNFTYAHHLLHGFMASVRESGLDHELIEGVSLESPPEELRQTLQTRFQNAAWPNGLICPGEVSGLAALAAIQDSDLVPGKDVHLVIKQTSGVLGLIRPRVASLYEDLTEAGEQMARLLVRAIAGEPPETLQYLQPVVEVR